MALIRKKKLLWVLIPVVVAAIAALLFFLWPRAHTPSVSWLDVSAYNAETGATLQLQNPEAGQAPVPLSRCSVTPPEGWEQLRDSARFANRYSQSHTDLFYREGQLVRLSQSYASDQTQVSFPTEDYDTVQFGGREIICYTGETQSGAVWVAGEHLFELTCSGVMEREQLLEWVAGVETENPQLPQTRPLEFVPGYLVSVETPEGAQWRFASWGLGGNPEPGEWEEQSVFAQLPEGFVLSEQSEDQYTCRWEYQTPAGDSLILENGRLTPYANILFSTTGTNFDDQEHWDLVEPVTVQDREGLLYWEEGSDISILVWLEEDYFVRLTYEGRTTPEQMLAWGESAVIEPV